MDDPTVGSQGSGCERGWFQNSDRRGGQEERHYKNREPRRDNPSSGLSCPPWLSFVRVSDRHGGLSLRTHFPMNSGFEEKD